MKRYFIQFNQIQIKDGKTLEYTFNKHEYQLCANAGCQFLLEFTMFLSSPFNLYYYTSLHHDPILFWGVLLLKMKRNNQIWSKFIDFKLAPKKIIHGKK